MNRNLEAIAIAAARECERQQVDEAALVRLLDAHVQASFQAEHGALPDLLMVLMLGAYVEPRPGRAAPIRVTPVTFTDGGTAVHHEVIMSTLERMFAYLDAETDPDEFTKAFLDVHPFEDGNGRVAWLLRNWLGGTLAEPVELPDYFGVPA